MNSHLLLFLKGIAMGAANVIPGVSGGTIAFITGIFEQLIRSLKAFDIAAARLLLHLRFRDFSAHVNLPFLVVLFAGVGVSLLSLGRLLDWLFQTHALLVWSFFFGLILASVYFVSKTIKSWNLASVACFAIGTAAALALAFVKPAAQDASFLYLVICGVVAICSMILPGLSGSFVLILMGNYQLIMLQAVPQFNLRIILPVGIGAAVGFVGLSHLISFLMRRFHDATLSILTGFILGSLVIIWPWKSEVYLTNPAGEFILKEGEKLVQGYSWHLPNLEATTWFALALIIVGIVAVAILENSAERR